MPQPAQLDEAQVRLEMFSHLDRLLRLAPDGCLRSADINTFRFQGHEIQLIGQQGIRKPAGLAGALTIRTAFTPPDRSPPYSDEVATDGLVRYKYRGLDPEHSDNRALRTAMLLRLPLAYFVGVDRGVYHPVYPVWVVSEDSSRFEFSVSLTEQRPAGETRLEVAEEQRELVLRLVRARLDQNVFRARVPHAYEGACAMCRLRHSELLDAAHILAGRQSVVPNGLALCKIHHAAFDANIIGVRPDRVIQVRGDILHEQDGPMLRHGLQDLHGEALQTPRQRLAQPDERLLATRYEHFQAA